MARYASSQEWLEFSVLPTRCWGQSRPKSHRDTGARSIPGHTSTASPQMRPPAKDCCSTRYCGKLGVDALAIDYSARLDSALTACFEASVAYSVSMSATGSSQPRRDVTPVHPAASRAPRLGSIRIRSSAFDSASWLWHTTKPALSASNGAIPHCSVTITGVPAATASAAEFPKFSFRDGSTKTSASL